MSDNITIKDPKTGNFLEVAGRDFPKMMNWHEAHKACASSGSGWRLPYLYELGVIYTELALKGKGNFIKDGIRSEYYLSATEVLNFGNDQGIWMINLFGPPTENFINRGFRLFNYKNSSRHSVRAVCGKPLLYQPILNLTPAEFREKTRFDRGLD